MINWLRLLFWKPRYFAGDVLSCRTNIAEYEAEVLERMPDTPKGHYRCKMPYAKGPEAMTFNIPEKMILKKNEK